MKGEGVPNNFHIANQTIDLCFDGRYKLLLDP